MDNSEFICRVRLRINACIRLLESCDTEHISTKLFVLNSLRSVQSAIIRKSMISSDLKTTLLRKISELIELANTSTNSNSTATGYKAERQLLGRVGPPKYNITREQLVFLIEFAGFSGTEVANIFNVSLSTIRRRLREFGIKVTENFSKMTDSQLDETVKITTRCNQLIGPNAVKARLKSQNINVQRSRVRESMLRVDPDGVALRSMCKSIKRREYNVAGPNSLWHVDGNHKLIRWRIVIHGGIDGYSRLVTFLKASNNNRASTVMDSFTSGVVSYGVPSRVRVDHGGENSDINSFMELYRGSDRGSCIRGKSVHNQRIERFWLDQWNGVVNLYHDIFRFLEHIHVLDVCNEIHLWILHYIFLPRLNRDLEDFVNQWNNHGLRTESSKTPLQIFIAELLQKCNSSLTAIRDIFDLETNESLESNESVQSGLADISNVTVPITPCPISSTALAALQTELDPLSNDLDMFGIGLFQLVLKFVEQP